MSLTTVLVAALVVVMLLLMVQVGALATHLLFLHGRAALRGAVSSAALLAIGTVLAAILGATAVPAEYFGR